MSSKSPRIFSSAGGTYMSTVLGFNPCPRLCELRLSLATLGQIKAEECTYVIISRRINNHHRFACKAELKCGPRAHVRPDFFCSYFTFTHSQYCRNSASVLEEGGREGMAEVLIRWAQLLTCLDSSWARFAQSSRFFSHSLIYLIYIYFGTSTWYVYGLDFYRYFGQLSQTLSYFSDNKSSCRLTDFSIEH